VKILAETSQKPSTVESPSFEQALASLEQIVRDLEDGRLGLTESLARYEEGVKLLRQCHELLARAERRIELLTGVDAAGNPVTKAFDDEATFIVPAAEAPTARRRKSAKKSPDVSASPTDTTSGQDTDMASESATSRMDEPGSLF
jgi:exodeoxyribonuclease VII small subunit